jgi:hypothetical protein
MFICVDDALNSSYSIKSVDMMFIIFLSLSLETAPLLRRACPVISHPYVSNFERVSFSRSMPLLFEMMYVHTKHSPTNSNGSINKRVVRVK